MKCKIENFTSLCILFLRLKITGYTSTEVKRNYNEKTYKRWYADLRKEVYSKIEKRKETGLSRAEFLKMLVSEKYNIKFD